MNLRTIRDETGTYIEIPRDRITFKSKEAEIIFDLTLENDELRLKNQELKEKVKKLSQWDINKDTRNSRQRVANAKLLKENQELKKQLEKYENEPLTNKISRIDCVVSNIYSRNKNQQKEFIKYLEDMIKELQKIKETELDYDILKDVIPQLLAYKEILQKYKKIIGVSDENN